MQIIVDVDEVVAALLPVWIRKIMEACPGCPDPRQNPNWDTWDIKDQIPDVYHDRMFDLINTHAIYDEVEPVPGALEGIARLRSAGHRLIFATSHVVGHAGAKLRWLVRQGVLENERHCYDYIETSDKSLVRGDILIDDRPRSCKNFVAVNNPWSAILFMPRDIHPRYRRGLTTARDWNDVVSIVLYGARKNAEAEAYLKEFLND